MGAPLQKPAVPDEGWMLGLLSAVGQITSQTDGALAESLDTTLLAISKILAVEHASSRLTVATCMETFTELRLMTRVSTRAVERANNLDENLRTPDDLWRVRLMEEDFHRLTFEAEDA